MSRATPRKSRHRQQPSASGGRPIGASDYESDAHQYQQQQQQYDGYNIADSNMPSSNNPPASEIPQRSNTELNLTVLRRYLPTISSIVSVAANAVIYTFSTAQQTWDKTGVEGTCFVCEQQEDARRGGTGPQACVFVLNRKGLDNIVIDLAAVSDCEVTPELLIFRMNEDADGAHKVVGVWMHTETTEADHATEAKAVTFQTIHELWRVVHQTRGNSAVGAGAGAGVGGGVEQQYYPQQQQQQQQQPPPPHQQQQDHYHHHHQQQQQHQDGGGMQGFGRRVSLSQLFAGGMGARGT